MITLSTQGLQYSGKPTTDPVWQEVMKDNTLTLQQIKALYESRKVKAKDKRKAFKVRPKMGMYPNKG